MTLFIPLSFALFWYVSVFHHSNLIGPVMRSNSGKITCPSLSDLGVIDVIFNAANDGSEALAPNRILFTTFRHIIDKSNLYTEKG